MSQGGVRVVARAGHRRAGEQVGPSSSDVSNLGRDGHQWNRSITNCSNSPNSVEIVHVSQLGSDEGSSDTTPKLTTEDTTFGFGFGLETGAAANAATTSKESNHGQIKPAPLASRKNSIDVDLNLSMFDDATPDGMAFGFGTGNAGTATSAPGHIKPSDRVSVNSHDGSVNGAAEGNEEGVWGDAEFLQFL